MAGSQVCRSSIRRSDSAVCCVAYGFMCLLDATYKTTRYALPLFFQNVH